MKNIKTVISLLVLTIFTFNLSGCMSANERLERNIKRANIEEISPSLYRGTTENFISNNAALNVSTKIATKHCRDKGLKKYIQQREIVDDVVHFNWACLSDNDSSDVAKKYKNIANEFIQNNIGIRKVGKYTYNITTKKTRANTEKLAALYCSDSPLNKNLTMLPQFQYGSKLTFACVVYDDESPYVLKLREKSEKYEKDMFEKDIAIAKVEAAQEAKRHARKMERMEKDIAIAKVEAARNAAQEAKRHARKMERMEQERLMLQKQQLYQSQQPQYAPAIKTECRNYLGQPECISYDTRDPKFL